MIEKIGFFIVHIGIEIMSNGLSMLSIESKYEVVSGVYEGLKEVLGEK